MTADYLVPMSSPDLTAAEREAVAAVLRTPQLSMGSEIEKLEAQFCEYLDSKHAIGVNSGTAGLHLCVRAAGVQEGDLVITTPFSFVASTNVLLFERAVPVFVDVDPIYGNINHQLVRQAVEEINKGDQEARKWLPRLETKSDLNLKAVLPVDVFGQPADMEPIIEVADQFGLKVIEDSCEALGAEYLGRKAGCLGNYGVFGFYPNKQLTTGEGGVIVTDDEWAAGYMRALRNQGRLPGDSWLHHTLLGYNYRLDEMSAALGRVQLGRLHGLMERRAQAAEWYSKRLDKVDGVRIPSVSPTTTRMSWFVYVIRLDPELDRDRVINLLEARRIPARPYFAPIHLQPYMVERFGYQPGDYPVAEDLGRRSLALPFSSVMTESQVEQVCNTLTGVLEIL